MAKILYEIAEYLKISGKPFKPRAHKRVARNIESLEEDLNEIYKKAD